MENAGRDLDDDTLRESMKKHGLGTPATRAAMIERLLQVGYAERKGRAIQATDKGIRLIAVAPPSITSAETTGRWEKGLSDIAAGELSPERFLAGIRSLSAALCEWAKAAPEDVQFEKEVKKGRPSQGTRARAGAVKQASIGVKCPLCQKGDVLENSKAFYCSRFRDGCALTVWKDAVARIGGPLLTAALVKRVIEEGRIVGSTGSLWHERGKVGFEGKR
jgi:DNA topoisomerase-3